MINSHKSIIYFGSRLTSRYKLDLITAFNDAAEELGVNMVYFHSAGVPGYSNEQYSASERELMGFIDAEQFDGIIYDGESFAVSGEAEKILPVLRRAKCPKVSVSTREEGFINIEFEDSEGIRMLTEHFINVHGSTRIGFMSGYLSHPDARSRLEVFREVMRSNGLPEDGAGVFEGDFWFDKGHEAAEYFLSLPEMPEAIVCANDYMAISLISALRERGIEVPRDIAVSGYDGTIDGQENYPRLTTATRERHDIARKAINAVLSAANGEDPGDMRIFPRCMTEQSCGCRELTYQPRTAISNMYRENRIISHNVRLSETAILRLGMAETVEEIEEVFATNTSNFGDFDSFFIVSYTDSKGRVSFDSAFSERSDKLKAVIKADKAGLHSIPEKGLSRSCIIPDCKSDRPQSYYIMSVHSNNRLFGYAIVSMSGHEIYNEFYIMWIMNIAMMLDRLLKKSRIDRLIGTLRDLSTTDELTGLLNRRGFDRLTNETVNAFDKKHSVCAMVIDMDGLKNINDNYGHHEGDEAIKAAADIILECCGSEAVCARTGGDEFFVFAADFTEEKRIGFEKALSEKTDSCNRKKNKPYQLSVSVGSVLAETDTAADLDELFRISDSRMYLQKNAKRKCRN